MTVVSAMTVGQSAVRSIAPVSSTRLAFAERVMASENVTAIGITDPVPYAPSAAVEDTLVIVGDLVSMTNDETPEMDVPVLPAASTAEILKIGRAHV